ncbi:hypothetical protein LOK49_LG12G02323 [Camellia lanceoleosa]|uniref:Uncharacterized protein n=1 Tax=Camellia lanceoleosa TaxID=1840588 RepID=A0ACC0FXJ0_9ERIC|nr:hypothetical protein LOK49_LG12G02323 [Camellia lanceoleosa]
MEATTTMEVEAAVVRNDGGGGGEDVGGGRGEDVGGTGSNGESGRRCQLRSSAMKTVEPAVVGNGFT